MKPRLRLLCSLLLLAIALAGSHNGGGGSEQDSHKPLWPLTAADYATVALSGVALIIAAGGGIGGGGVLVPIYILVLGFSTKKAVPISNVTILGGAIANIAYATPGRHPLADRPLQDWSLIVIMELMTMVGSVFGAIAHKLLPPVVISILLVVVLSAMGYRTVKKGVEQTRKEGGLRRMCSLHGGGGGDDDDGDKHKQNQQHRRGISKTSHDHGDKGGRMGIAGSAASRGTTSEGTPAAPKEGRSHWQRWYRVCGCGRGHGGQGLNDGGGGGGSGEEMKDVEDGADGRAERGHGGAVDGDGDVDVGGSVGCGGESGTPDGEKGRHQHSKRDHAARQRRDEDDDHVNCAHDVESLAPRNGHGASTDSTTGSHKPENGGGRERGTWEEEGGRSKGCDIDQLRQDDRRVAAWKPVVLTVALLGIVAFNLLRGSSQQQSPLGIKCGQAWFWVLTLASVPWVGVLFFFARRWILEEHEIRRRCCYPFVEGDIQWTRSSTVKFPLLCVGAGLVAGTFGVGGGIIQGPLMLEMHVLPQVASASAAVMVLYTAAAACVTYMVQGQTTVDYSIFFFLWGFTCTMFGQHAVTSVVKKYKKESLIVLSIGAVVVFSALLMTYQAIHEAMQDPHSLTKITGVCSSGGGGSH